MSEKEQYSQREIVRNIENILTAHVARADARHANFEKELMDIKLNVKDTREKHFKLKEKVERESTKIYTYVSVFGVIALLVFNMIKEWLVQKFK